MPFYPSLEKALERQPIDAAVICAPHFAHEPIATRTRLLAGGEEPEEPSFYGIPPRLFMFLCHYILNAPDDFTLAVHPLSYTHTMRAPKAKNL
jgi:hypothetical protein